MDAKHASATAAKMMDLKRLLMDMPPHMIRLLAANGAHEPRARGIRKKVSDA
jgi:hypothetical protein